MMFRRLVLNSVATAAYRFASLGVTLLLTPFLIASLGQGIYGLVVLLNVFSVAGYGSLADLGLASAVVKFTAQYGTPGREAERAQLLGTSFTLYVLIGSLVALLVQVAGDLVVTHVFQLTPEERGIASVLLPLVAVGVLVDFIAVWLSAVLEGAQRYDLINGIQFVRTIAGAALVVATVGAGLGAEGWLWSTLVASAGAMLAMYLTVCRVADWSIRRIAFHADVLRTVWTFSAKVFALRISSVLYATIDRTVLGAFHRPDALASYDVASKVHAVTAMPMAFTTGVTLPAASDLEARGRTNQLRELFLRGTLYTVALSLPAVVAVLVLAPALLEAWVGAPFVQLTPTVRLFVSYLLVWSLPQVGWNMMIGLGRTTKLLPINLTSVGLNTILSVALAPTFGVAGVVTATVVGNAVATPWYLRVFLRELDIPFRAFATAVLLRTFPIAALVAAGLVIGVAQWPPRSLWAIAAWIVAAYGSFGGLFWIVGVDSTDRRRFMALLRERLA